MKILAFVFFTLGVVLVYSLFPQEFEVPLIVNDGIYTDSLIIGVHPLGTDGYDAGLDEICGTGTCLISYLFSQGIPYSTDIRDNLISEKTFKMYFQTPSTPLVLTWNPSVLTLLGSFTIVDDITGTQFSLDMTTTDSLIVSDHPVLLNGLRILVTPYPPFSTFQKSISNGWNLIGLPLEVLDNYYLSIYPSAIPNTCFSWAGYYSPEDSLEMFKGYWLRFSHSDTVAITGFPVNACIMVDVYEGWNLIAGVSGNEALSDVGDPDSIIIPGTLYGFIGTYVLSDTIKQGEGYWLRTSASGQIILCPPTNERQAFGKKFEIRFDFSACPQLLLGDASGVSQTLYFRVNLPEEISKLSFSLPPLPPAGAFDARFSGNYRICEGDKAVIEVQASAYPLTINAENLPELPEGYRYVIREILPGGEGKVHVLSEGRSVEITNPQVKSLQLGKQEIVPLIFAVEQNYPNPFNPTTEIRYSIPMYQRVEIVVYNSLGQKVKRVLSAKQEAGRHTVVWDATNENGQPVSSGIYFYIVTASGNKVVKKMILLR